MTKRTKKVKNYEGCLFQPGIQYFVCVLSENIEGNPSSLLALLPYPPLLLTLDTIGEKRELCSFSLSQSAIARMLLLKRFVVCANKGFIV